ncbi:MAG: helix-hairpin-helix domain-containing protein [Clostridiales bacterium]|nr:helix-hairpin-helix domain-containing protein [Clostridiales bacterium]
MERDRVKIIGIFVSIFLVLCGYYYFTKRHETNKKININKAQEEKIKSENIEEYKQDVVNKKKTGIYYQVHVAGAVNKPGVYTLDSSDRVVNAIEMAGGATDQADLDKINLAEKIKDGQKIKVPTYSEKTDSDEFNFNNYKLNDSGLSKNIRESMLSSDDNNKIKKKLNINTATSKELENLPGIGSVIADNIIKFRENNGEFSSISELKSVARVGDKTFYKIQDLITVD